MSLRLVPTLLAILTGLLSLLARLVLTLLSTPSLVLLVFQRGGTAPNLKTLI